ncbi:MAG: serine hydrolase [Chloroflexota bacterium]|nr:serine hydrolase [Chloroflexota bacterium]
MKHSRNKRWVFRNIDDELQWDIIKSSSSPCRLPADFRDINPIKFTNHASDSVSVGESLKFLYADSLVVVKGEQIINEQYFNGMTESTAHILFSASKPFAGALIAILIRDHTLASENDLITIYLPQLKDTAFKDVSIRHLLDMQSGIDIRDLDDPRELERASGYAVPVGDESISTVLLKFHSKKYPAGVKTDYLSINTDLLSLLAARVTGKPAAVLLQEVLFESMGIEFTAYLLKDQKGVNALSGGLALTVRDLVKLGVLLVNDGVLHGNQVLPKGYIKTIIDTAEPEKWIGSWIAQLTPQAKAYRSCLYICSDNFDNDSFFAVGNYGNALYINTREQAVIALQSSYPSAVDIPRFTTKMNMLKAIANGI